MAQYGGQQGGVHRQSSGPLCGVTLVEEGSGVAEQQGLGERGGCVGGDLGDAHPPGPHRTDDLLQGRQVVDVAQAFAHGLHHHRELRVRPGDVQQLGGTLSLLPQGLAFAGVTPRQQQGPGGTLAEPSGEQCGGAHRIGDLVDHRGGVHGAAAACVLNTAGTTGEQFHTRRVLGVRQAQDDTVVPGHRHRVDTGVPRQGRPDRQRPRCIDRASPRGVHDHPPVADLVVETFDEDGALIGHDLGGLPLFGVEGVEVGSRVVVEEGRGPYVVLTALAPAATGRADDGG